MSERFSRSSLRRLGLRRANSSKASASERNIQPRPRVTIVMMMKMRPAARRAARSGHGSKGAMVKSQLMLLPQPLEQRRDMHLIGLVVAGQRVHHDVDAGAIGEFALAVAAGRHRIERLAAIVLGPGRGIVVGTNDDRGHAVGIAGICRPSLGGLYP